MYTIRLNDAVDILLRSRRDLTVTRARQWLIAALICGDFAATARRYSQQLSPLKSNSLENFEQAAIPDLFWKEVHWNDHADILNRTASKPTGPYADWGNSKFVTTMTRFASALEQQFPNLSCGRFGSVPFTLTLTAEECTITVTDLEMMLQNKPTLVIERARRKPAIHMGNVTKSDRERLIARYCAMFLTLAEQIEIASSADTVITSLQNVSPYAQVDDKFYRRFADLLVDETAQLSKRLAKRKEQSASD